MLTIHAPQKGNFVISLDRQQLILSVMLVMSKDTLEILCTVLDLVTSVSVYVFRQYLYF